VSAGNTERVRSWKPGTASDKIFLPIYCVCLWAAPGVPCRSAADGNVLVPETFNMEHGTWNMEHGTWNMSRLQAAKLPTS
jgi:hypothetical protein